MDAAIDQRDSSPDENVAMGGTFDAATGVPIFEVWATKDDYSAPLERIQMIKGWRAESGVLVEEIYDIACFNGGPDEKTGRCPAHDTFIDLETCTLSSKAGANTLSAEWKDPEFDPGLHAFYYARVIELPTCRWSTWDAKRARIDPPTAADAAIQERAWGSPIWIKPAL